MMDDERETASESEMIPCVELSKDGLELEEGTEEWKNMSKKVREACESYGCFVLKYDKIPLDLREDMFMCIKAFFDLPEETKLKHISPKPHRSYNSYNPFIPLCQSLGVDDASNWDNAQAFTNLMWPQGNPTFCETMNSTSSKMLDLSFLILKMILEGFDLPKHYTSDLEDLKSHSNFRLIKYKAPNNNKDCETGLLPHTDKNTMTILCQNEVQGLEILTKGGKWIPLNLPRNGFVVFVGDLLKAWSNGRLHAATHRVMMGGDKNRYSFGLFTLPKEEMKIKVSPDLVDEKMHPLCYRPFTYEEYLKYFVSNPMANVLDVFTVV